MCTVNKTNGGVNVFECIMNLKAKNQQSTVLDLFHFGMEDPYGSLEREISSFLTIDGKRSIIRGIGLIL